jgi:hypothetical protein
MLGGPDLTRTGWIPTDLAILLRDNQDENSPRLSRYTIPSLSRNRTH